MSAAITATAPRFGIATLMSGFDPKPFLAPPDEQGNPTAEEAAAAEAARIASEKEAADKAVADKAAADKAAAEKAEADRIEAEKNMTDAEKEKNKLLREVMEKKNKLKETEAERDAAKAEAEKFKGLDLDKIKALLEAEKTREEKELEAKGDFDRLKARIAEEREAEKAAWETERQALQTRINELSGNIDTLTIGNDFGTSKFIQDDLVIPATKARILYGSHFELKDGKNIAYDKPKGSSNRTPLVDAAGEPLSFDAALRKIVEADPDRDSLLRSKVTPGANSKSNSNGNSAEKKNDGSELKGASRILAALNKESNNGK